MSGAARDRLDRHASMARMSRSSRLVAATALALIASFTPATAAQAVELVGNGYGHGKGLSQYGAQRAASNGVGHRKILSFYYPRTRFGKAGGTIKVLISGDTGNDLVVKDRSGLRVRSLGSNRTWRLRTSAARKWRITPADGGARSTIAWRGSGGWTVWRTVRGQAEFSAGGKPVRLLGPAGPTSYRGTLRSAENERGRVTVNVLPLEQYLRGVVPLEVPAEWSPAAVRAQAIAARTYAAFERRNSTRAAYDLCDTTSCQVYGGASAEHPASNKAVRKTRKDVVVRKGKSILAQFNASSGGWTADGGRPYLVARKDPWSRRAYHHWRATITRNQIEQQWPGIGNFRRIKILRRTGDGEWNGRVVRLRVVGSRDRVTMSGEDFRFRFGLRSSWFRVAR